MPSANEGKSVLRTIAGFEQRGSTRNPILTYLELRNLRERFAQCVKRQTRPNR